jgi:glucose/arabinose dehydrogenase
VAERPLRRLAIAGALLAAALPATAAAGPPRVSTVATGLEVPWDIAFLPDGRALVTERPGRVRLLGRAGRLRRAPVARIPVTALGEGGLLGVAVDPAFRRNHFVYLYYTTLAGMQLERWRLTGGRLVRQTGLVRGIAAGTVHDSGRIAFDPAGRLFVSTGDAGRPALAQDPASLNGKFLVLSPRQYRAHRHVRPTIFSMGHRNSQGFGWQPGSGRMVATEHGPSGFDGPEGWDEVNVIRRGGNYGWPNVLGPAQPPPYIAPLRLYPEPLAPSGATFVRHPGSAWTGDFIFACLRGQQLRRLVLHGGALVREEALLLGRFGRLRTVVEGPRGDLYVLTSNRDGRGAPVRDDDRILRIVPPRRS